MNAPLISILLPFYNSQFFLKNCLDSIKKQTLKEFEVILINDGSTDRSNQIATEFTKKDRRFKLFNLEKNTGIVHALNFGIKQCHGSYIARMDADDVMLPERLFKQLDFAKKNPRIDLVGSQVELLRTDAPITKGQKNYINWSNSLISDQQIKDQIFVESPVIHPTFFMKKSFMEKMGGYQDNPWAEDYDFILRAFINGGIFGKLPEKLLVKQDHPDRVVRNDVRCKRKAMFAAKAHYFKKSELYDKNRIYALISGNRSKKMVLKALAIEGIKVNTSIEPFCENDFSIIADSKEHHSLNKQAEISSSNYGLPFYFIAIDKIELKVSISLKLAEKGLILNKDFAFFI